MGLTVLSRTLYNLAMPRTSWGLLESKQMNSATKEIMALLKIDADTALKVQYEMMSSGFDFSAASKRQFNSEAKFCFSTLQAK